MLFTICAGKHHKLFYNCNLMDYHSQEPRREKSIKEHLEGNPDNMENSKHIEHAQLLIELDTQCCTLCLVDP